MIPAATAIAFAALLSTAQPTPAAERGGQAPARDADADAEVIENLELLERLELLQHLDVLIKPAPFEEPPTEPPPRPPPPAPPETPSPPLPAPKKP